MKVGAGDTAMKTCTGPCGEMKRTSCFGIKRTTKDGMRSTCKLCAAAAQKIYVERNVDKMFDDMLAP